MGSIPVRVTKKKTTPFGVVFLFARTGIGEIPMPRSGISEKSGLLMGTLWVSSFFARTGIGEIPLAYDGTPERPPMYRPHPYVT